MLMVEKCRLGCLAIRIRKGGAAVVARGCGVIAPGSARESVVPVDRDGAAAAHGGVMQICLDMSNIMVVSAGSLTQLATCFSGQGQNHR